MIANLVDLFEFKQQRYSTITIAHKMSQCGHDRPLLSAGEPARSQEPAVPVIRNDWRREIGRYAYPAERGFMNIRVVGTGAGLIVLAAAFFFYMATLAPQSTDPDALMRTVGMVSGGAAGLGGAMILFGMFRRKTRLIPVGFIPG
jgi:hypothetical protein